MHDKNLKFCFSKNTHTWVSPANYLCTLKRAQRPPLLKGKELPFSLNSFSQVVPTQFARFKSKNITFTKFSWSMSYPPFPPHEHTARCERFLFWNLKLYFLWKILFYRTSLWYRYTLHFLIPQIVSYLSTRYILICCDPKIFSILICTCQALI